MINIIKKIEKSTIFIIKITLTNKHTQETSKMQVERKINKKRSVLAPFFLFNKSLLLHSLRDY